MNIKTIPTDNSFKKTTAMIAVIQLFSTISLAILYSTLVLYATQKLKMSVPAATAVMGAFAAFNYGLHILGGFFGGRLLSWRLLFIVGMTLLTTGCILLSIPTLLHFHLGVAFFLAGTGLNVTCINMMVTQLFEPDDKRRESVFFWNYALMNVGFFIGYSLAGYFQLKQEFQSLFLVASLGSIFAALITLFNWKKLKDRNTVLSGNITRSETIQRLLGGLILISLLVPALYWFIQYAQFSNKMIIIIGILMMGVLFTFAVRQQNSIARSKMFAYIIFAFASLIFWTLYQLAPMGLTVFVQYNVNRHYWGFLLAPQWILNINTFVIAAGGPLLAYILHKLHNRGLQFSLALKFSLALAFIGCGFVILPIGIKFAAPDGLVGFNWILTSYILQSLGELFIGPIGYAMIGQLAPQKLQGVMMGTWMMCIGVGATLSNYASVYAIHHTSSNNPLITNPGYAHMFNLLGSGSIIAGFILFIGIPLLKKLTQED